MTDISSVVRSVVDTYDISPYEINNGRCEEFMKNIMRLSPATEECCTGFVLANENMTYPPHVWVYYNGKHYDAECPEGVSDFRELPFFSDVEIDEADILESKFTR